MFTSDREIEISVLGLSWNNETPIVMSSFDSGTGFSQQHI
jgi:hypothetical protein